MKGIVMVCVMLAVILACGCAQTGNGGVPGAGEMTTEATATSAAEQTAWPATEDMTEMTEEMTGQATEQTEMQTGTEVPEETAAAGPAGEPDYTGEYASADGMFEMKWRTDSEKIYVTMTGKSPGWVSVGFNPTYVMKDADIILGYLAAGEQTVHDMYSTGAYGPHPDDAQQGGTYDILSYSVTEEGGATTVVFSRYLDTKDSLDSELAPGDSVKIIWAIANKDVPDLRHNVAKGSATITI